MLCHTNPGIAHNHNCWLRAEGVAGSNMAGVIVLTGRAKDTIVLSSGENIEPGAVEDAAVCSPLIKFCVLLGQDRRSLGALIVPDAEAFEELGMPGQACCYVCPACPSEQYIRFMWASQLNCGLPNLAMSADLISFCLCNLVSPV